LSEAGRKQQAQRNVATRTPGTADTGTDITAQREPEPRSSRTADPATRRHHNRNGTTGGDARTTNTSNPQPEPQDVHTADDAATSTVIIQPQDFRLPDVLRHIEAGKIVLVMPHHNGAD
jgi:hypothetical protein